MKKRHAKSACCHVRVIRYGNRRRQCVRCKQTWSIRKKKRGKKRLRKNYALITSTIGESLPAKAVWRRRTTISLPGLRKRIRYAVAAIAARPRHDRFHHRSYVLVMDGLRFIFKDKPWTLYVIAAKPVTKNIAIFSDPVLIEGDEGARDWRRALDILPLSLIRRVSAMVSDGFQGSGRIARERGWIHQRCHFHLLYSLRNRLGRRRSTVRARHIRETIYRAICNMITDPHTKKMGSYARVLYQCARDSRCPKTLIMIVRDFLREFHAFRSYLAYPHLHLPCTTGTIESMNKILRASCGTVNGPNALQKRAVVVIRLRRKLICNGKIYQQN